MPDDFDYSQFFKTDVNLKNPELNREILSILRSDLTIFSSDFEQKIFEEQFGIKDTLLLPNFYFADNPENDPLENYSDFTVENFFNVRRNILFFGNYEKDTCQVKNYTLHIIFYNSYNRRIFK